MENEEKKSKLEPVSMKEIKKFLEKNTFEVIEGKQSPKAKVLMYTDSIRVEAAAFLTWAMLNHSKHAIGLAANQCKLKGKVYNKNFFVILGKINQVYINPEIIEYSGQKTTVMEGCLTWPNKKIKAVRYNDIKVKFTNIDGEEKEEEIPGFYSQVFQHEYNHLQGIAEDVYEKGGIIAEEKIGRNDPCPCGSSKKYKKCCGWNHDI